MFKHCLICTDFSDGLQRFAHHIEKLSQTGLRKVVFLHTLSVWEDERIAGFDDDKITEAKAYLESLLQSVPPDITVMIEVSPLRYLDKIHQLIEREAIDLIITGMPVRNNLEVKLFGSHTIALIRSTSVPVMILRPQLISTYTKEEVDLRCQHLWQHLLVPFDDGPAGRYLLARMKAALEKDSNHNVKSCRFLCVVEDAARSSELLTNHQETAQTKLSEAAAMFDDLVPEIITEVRVGNPLHEILDAAFVNDISALAIGSYRETILDWTVPSLADSIVTRSWFPLLFFSPAH